METAINRQYSAREIQKSNYSRKKRQLTVKTSYETNQALSD